MGGFGYILLVLGLSFVVPRNKGSVGVGQITIVQLKHGRRKMPCLGGIEKKKDASLSEL